MFIIDNTYIFGNNYVQCCIIVQAKRRKNNFSRLIYAFLSEMEKANTGRKVVFVKMYSFWIRILYNVYLRFQFISNFIKAG